MDDESRQPVKGIPDHKIVLTEKGRDEARKVGLALREKFGIPDYLYHSGYLRTVKTSEEILAAYTEEERLKIKIRHNLFIRERDSGYAYDMTTEEAEKAFPWLKEYWKTFGGFFSHPPGGESLAQVCDRVYLFLNMLFRDRADQNIFVVTHGGTIRAFRFLLEHWDYEEVNNRFRTDPPKNCSVTVYEYDPDKMRLVLKEYNSIYW